MLFYYGVYSRRTGKIVITCSALDPYLMTGDYLLFDTEVECRNYWEKQGCEVAE